MYKKRHCFGNKVHRTRRDEKTMIYTAICHLPVLIFRVLSMNIDNANDDRYKCNYKSK